jgi:hypothetical protein
MTNSKLLLAPFIADVMLSRATTTVKQEAFAKHQTHPKNIESIESGSCLDMRKFCGINYQSKFHLSLGNVSLSIPAGMCFPDYEARMGPAL